ncbi:MAG: hypothetical protein M3O30_14800 [Planctomycetota bacterium]|nr:hypothetical protein [Planctomycetota bacterium]
MPDNIDLDFLTGVMLMQVCIGANDIILRFQNQISVNMQTDIAHRNATGDITALYKSLPAAAQMLVGFLHHKIEKAVVVDASTLRLIFSSGESIEIYDTSAQYESYQIRYADKVIVV